VLLDGRQALAESSTPRAVAGDERPTRQPKDRATATDDPSEDNASPVHSRGWKLWICSTSRSANGARSAARSVLALRAIGRTAAIERVSGTENPKSIRALATPIDRRMSHGESPSNRAVLGETPATANSPEEAAAARSWSQRLGRPKASRPGCAMR